MQQVLVKECCGTLRAIKGFHTARLYVSSRYRNKLGPARAMPTSQLWQSIQTAYEAAQQSGASTQTETKLRTQQDLGVTFYIRQATSLQKKPKPAGSDQKRPANPFLPYDERLWVSHLSDTHTLLLNKFNVVEHHLLVVTRSYASQLDSLRLPDFEALLLVLQAVHLSTVIADDYPGCTAMPAGGLAFFNCGNQSGASQPHKHIQIVPQPLGDDPTNPLPFKPIIQACLQASSALPCTATPLKKLPFTSFCASLPPKATAEDMLAAYSSMMQAVSLDLDRPSASYNCWFTTDLGMLATRTQEKDGPCSINTLGFAGTVLVKSDQDMDYIVQKGCMEVLRSVGVPWTA